MIVLVTGGRTFGERDGEFDALCDALYDIDNETRITCVVHGHAHGADAIARGWAELRREGPPARPDIHIQGFRADWNLLGRGAGHERNARMVAWVASRAAAGERVLVLACPGGRGTADCVAKARAAGLTVKTLDEVLGEQPWP